MKPRHIAVALVLFACILLLGCGKSALTNQMAENAIRQWLSQTNNPEVKVLGIQEIPQQNIARATVTLSHLFYNSPRGIFYSNQKLDYSGPAEAIFTHYNDGRWVLTHVTVPDVAMFGGKAEFDMTVEAK